MPMKHEYRRTPGSSGVKVTTFIPGLRTTSIPMSADWIVAAQVRSFDSISQRTSRPAYTTALAGS